MLNSIEKLIIMKKVLNMESYSISIDEIIEDIRMKIVVLDDYASEIEALKKEVKTLKHDGEILNRYAMKLEASQEEYKKRLCE